MKARRFFSRVAGFLRAASGYTGAQVSRFFRNWKPSFGSPDGEIIYDLPLLRARCRDLYRNNAIARGAIKVKAANVVGRGLKMQCAIDRETITEYLGWDLAQVDEYFDALEDRVERDFATWAESKDSDSKRQRNFYENQMLAYISREQSGEVFTAFPYRKRGGRNQLTVQLFEADQVQSPTHGYSSRIDRDGIVLDDCGQPIGAWVNYNQEVFPGEFKFIPFYGRQSGRPLLLHLYTADRPGQTRGVPALAPVVTTLKHLDDYKRSELIRAKVVSYFTTFVTSPKAEPLYTGIGLGNQDESEKPRTGEDYEMGPGAVMHLQEGEDVKFANPGNVSSNYAPFADSLMIEIGMALSIPYEILRRYFGASYSASRGAKAEFQKEVLIDRDWMELNFCIPIYREWFIEQVLSGRYQLPGFWASREVQNAYLGSTWTGEAMGLIDPTKEIEAANMKVEAGYSNRTEETAALTGGDYRRNLIILRKEKKLRARLGLDEPVSKSSITSPTGESMGSNTSLETSNSVDGELVSTGVAESV